MNSKYSSYKILNRGQSAKDCKTSFKLLYNRPKMSEVL